MFDEEGLFIQLPTVMKAHQDGDRRLVEICASKQVVDAEGDLVLQAALLNSAAGFVKSGHLDLEHISEIYDRVPGIRGRASDYIVGNPLEVRDLGGGSTGVIGEMQKGNPHADEIWAGLIATPPVRWQASIYGFPLPNGLHDARTAKSEDMMGATRFLVTALDWRSLAFTRRPINQAVDAARVYTAKSFIALMKARMPGLEIDKTEVTASIHPVNYLLPPRNTTELMGHLMYHMRRGHCPYVNKASGLSRNQIEFHFTNCCGLDDGQASIYAHALMNLLKREKASDIGLSSRA